MDLIQRDRNNPLHALHIIGFLSEEPDYMLLHHRYPNLGTPDHYSINREDLFICALYEPADKLRMIRPLKEKGAKFVNFIHSSVHISPHSSIGQGTVIFPYLTINANARIGEFCTMLSGIGHDSTFGDFSTVGRGSDITGHVSVGTSVKIGHGSVIIPEKQVGNNAVLKDFCIAITKVKENTVVSGNPARREK